MNNNKRVLITALGTMNGSAIVSELRRKKPDLYLIGADINPSYCITASKFVDEFVQFPPAIPNTEDYYGFVLKFCKEHNIDYIYCFIDEEVATFAHHRDSFLEIDTKVLIADTHTIDICHRKDEFQKWITANISQIAIKGFNKEDLKDDDFPVFVKPVEGRASIGCKIIENKNQLNRYEKEIHNFIIQEVVTGEIISVDIVRNRITGQQKILQKQELLRNSNGCGTAIEIVNNEELGSFCNLLAEKLNLHGVVNTEFFITPAGPKIIEVNPRLPAGTDFSCMAGLNTVMNSMLIADGCPCVFDEIKIGHHFTKRYEAYEM